MKTKCGTTNGSRRWSQHAACVSACVVVLCLTPFCWMTAQAGVPWPCWEPPPVGNAYRTWEQGASYVTYECFPTYELTGGDLNRTCDIASANFSGQAPVCTCE
ncbi:hypothetical protein V1264_000034 [Littorina saxatilis]|uniref:Uncharacterized protein n=1 Tax=Littorina saxatilis TaxID=31220 RepID=A0AAN9BXY4_9CAEN